MPISGLQECKLRMAGPLVWESLSAKAQRKRHVAAPEANLWGLQLGLSWPEHHHLLREGPGPPVCPTAADST